MSDNMMWALVKEKPEAGLWMKRVPIPEVGPNDVKIKIHKTAICGTDVHIYQWNEWAQHTIPVGLTAGHEYVGEVVEVGPGVQGFKIGDLVSGEGHITCGKCRNCLEGHKENCKDAKGVGVNRNGAFAEYLVIPSSNVWPCNPNIPEAVSYTHLDVYKRQSFQFVRQGYFCVDAKDSTPDALVFNRIVSLKSSFRLPKK